MSTCPCHTIEFIFRRIWGYIARPRLIMISAMTSPGPSEIVTRDIRVAATPFYIPDESDPGERLYMFGYNISITNEGPAAVQLLTRHWVVIDAVGRREEVKGAGVIGQTPTLQPG